MVEMANYATIIKQILMIDGCLKVATREDM
jgi:hypothetical protein